MTEIANFIHFHFSFSKMENTVHTTLRASKTFNTGYDVIRKNNQTEKLQKIKSKNHWHEFTIIF